MKTIQLSGGLFHGKRMVVPIYSAELKFVAAKTDGECCYLPASHCTKEGLEVWELAWTTNPAESVAVQVKG